MLCSNCDFGAFSFSPFSELDVQVIEKSMVEATLFRMVTSFDLLYLASYKTPLSPTWEVACTRNFQNEYLTFTPKLGNWLLLTTQSYSSLEVLKSPRDLLVSEKVGAIALM